MSINTVPLSSSFMLTSIIGFIVAWQWVLPRNSTWGLTFLIFFVLMFISSIISMTYLPTDAEEPLQIKKRKK